MRIGSLKFSNAKIYSEFPVDWSDGPLKILGILVTADLGEMTKMNYQKSLEKIKNVLTLWSLRSLTVIGKIQIINSLVIPHLTYLFQSLPSPNDEFWKEYKKLINQFLWKNKPPRRKYEILIQNYEKGGLKLLDPQTLDQSMKIKMFNKCINLMEQNDDVFLALYRETVSIPFELVHRCNLCKKDIIENSTENIWRSILIAWEKFKNNEIYSRYDIANEIIWYNKEIRVANKPLFIKKMYRKGINTVSCLMSNDKTQLLEFTEFNNRHPYVSELY